MSSIIYKNIVIYRVAMQLLYKGRYYNRFTPIKKIMMAKRITSVQEFCFGDTMMANFCRKNSISWTGYDVNPVFVNHARKEGYDAHCADLGNFTGWKESDAVLIMGSLYHFKKNAANLIKESLKRSKWVIVNEPVKNLSDRPFLGKVAAWLTDAGKGSEKFRFTRQTLLEMADSCQSESTCFYYIAHEGKKDLTLVFERK